MLLQTIKHIPFKEVLTQATDSIVLEAQERHVRRKLIVTTTGLEILIDLQRPVFLEDGDQLELSNGQFIQAIAAEEDLLEVIGTSAAHMVRLGWHIGNRHLAAQLAAHRILIKPDRVIEAMLVGLNAKVRMVREKFNPEHGAYHGH